MIPGVNYVIKSILELPTGGKYYCSYYSRHGDKWPFEKAN